MNVMLAIEFHCRSIVLFTLQPSSGSYVQDKSHPG